MTCYICNNEEDNFWLEPSNQDEGQLNVADADGIIMLSYQCQLGSKPDLMCVYTHTHTPTSVSPVKDDWGLEWE